MDKIRERYAEWSKGGHFVAECLPDEDGVVYYTGRLLFICDPEGLGPDDDPVVEAGYFEEPDDAERFIQMLEDMGELLGRQ